jgi:peptidyl-dipeptidase A
MSFPQFLESFIPKVKTKFIQANLASWLLETTGSKDASSLKTMLDIELKLLFHDKETFKLLQQFDADKTINDPILKRQLNVLLRTFKPNLASKDLLEKIALLESSLAYEYANFRPTLEGQNLSENDIKELLKSEVSKEKREAIWLASKQIGPILAPKIIELIKLRNELAVSLGYKNYFSMQLELQEVDEKALFELLESLEKDSREPYKNLITSLSSTLATRFNTKIEEIGPWAFSEPFCQEDPLDTKELDLLLEGVDLLKSASHFYKLMGFDVSDILKNSDNFERPGKNQHAFCINIDRKKDIRTLNNLKPSIKWLETLLHELGHAVYELGFDETIPWDLKEPPHMITTEAIALLAGRQAYKEKSLNHLVGDSKKLLKRKAEESLKRRQLIFCRWVLHMTYFERELYQSVDQDLNSLWWSFVEKFQMIKCSGSIHKADWACKYHISLAPVYYFSYLLGELFASNLEVALGDLFLKSTGSYLNEQLFKKGNTLNYNDLIKHVINKPLDSKDWVEQFCKNG